MFWIIFAFMLHIGKVMTKVLMAFLVLSRELQFFMEIGALFQALVASFMKVHVDF